MKNSSHISSLARSALVFSLAAFLFITPGMAATQNGPNFVVNSLADTDDGSADLPGQGTGNQDCTLREAILATTAYGDGATITFSVSGTISLGSMLPEVNRRITIDGSGQSVVVDGNGTVQAMQISSRFFSSDGYYITVNINALTFRRTLVAIRSFFANVNLSNCTFDSNAPTVGYGGGIYATNQSEPLNITNCTFLNNTSFGGAAVHAESYIVTHCTFYGNRGILSGQPGTLYGSGRVRNSIFAFSRNGRHCIPGVDIDSSNLADDTSCGTATVVTTAQINLQALAPNGGPTPTMALGAGSVAIGAANPALSSASPANNRDQRGLGRVSVADPASDAGAYEANSPGPPAAAPTFSPAPGTYVAPALTVTLATTTPGTSIYYTINGSAPSPTNGTLYSGPFIASAVSTTVRAIAIAPGFANSIIVEGTYTRVTETASLVVNAAVDVVDDFDNLTSLREAVAYAQSLGGAQTVTFAPALHGQTLTLSSGSTGAADDTARRVNSGSITIAGPAAGVTLAVAGGSARRHFYVASGATLALSNLTLTGGSPAANGGAAHNQGTLTVSNCTFMNNSAGEGGAIESTGTLTITGSTFRNNASGFNGGALRFSGTATISGSTFNANTVVNEGGALISFGDLTVTNCTFADNGKNAVLLWQGTADLRYLTVAYNRNGGLAMASAATTLRNSVVAGNTGSDVFGTLASGSSNNVLNVSAAAAGLGTLASNGGPTQTIALVVPSPAIEGAAPLPGITTDQRGVVRPQYGSPDMGAYEFDGALNPSLIVTTAVDESDTNSDPRFGSGTSLREAVAYAGSLGTPQTVTFAPAVQGQTLTLVRGVPDEFDGESALYTYGDVTIDGGSGVTITHDGSSRRRLIRTWFSAKLTLVGLTLTGGDAPENGGAILNEGMLLQVRNCTLANNRALYGGAIYAAGEFSVSGCTFVGNTADSDGGAIYISTQSHRLENSTFVNNMSPLGSAVTTSDPGTWDHLTVVDNVGVAAFNLRDAAITMRNSIVARNTGEGAFTSDSDGTGTFTMTSTNNFVAGTAWTGLNSAANSLNVNPTAMRLGTLANNGGPTQTIALLAGSPAVNGGIAISGLTTDQRGIPRPQFGVADIGAFEQTAFESGGTIITAGDALWYLGPDAIGADLRVYREVPNELAEWVGGGFAAQIGQIGDGTVLVRNSGGLVFSRPGSNSGIGSSWQLLTSVFAADGATWFLGPDGNGNDPHIYRWDATGTLAYSGGAGSQLFVAADGTILTRNNSGAFFQRLGSNTGLGSGWQLLSGSLVVTTTIDENDGSSVPQLGTGTSLREALAYAQSLGGSQTITFAAPLHGQTITLSNGSTGSGDDTALRVNSGNLTIDGGTGLTLTVASGTARRHFLVATGATLALSNLTLTGGNPATNGGAAYSNGTLSVSNCTIMSNSAGEGGAIESTGTLTITDSTFRNNASSSNGGALRFSGTATISGSTFNANTVLNEGGALMSFGDLTATNCTFADNGKNAILLWQGSADLRHLTVAYNHNGGLAIVSAATTLRNSVVTANTGFDLSGTLAPASSNNLLNLSTDAAGLGVLANNGGPTQTIALLADSPALDAGVSIAGITTDQRGISRASVPDIGACEIALSGLPLWRSMHGLAANGSQDLANPSGDGVANLLKYAFNMAPNGGDLSQPNVSILQPNGNTGLPSIWRDSNGQLTIEFLRRKSTSNPGISYVVQTGDNLSALQPLSLTGASIVSIDTVWERITVVDPAITTKRFGRVGVTSLGQ